MTSAAAAPPGIADDRLAELLGLVRGADGVELKLTVPEPDQRSTMEALAMDPIDAQIRQVFFFDTPDLTLNQAGDLAQQGIDLSGEQQTKTRRALEFFSARLKKQADDRHARNTGTRGQEETP